MRVNLLKKAKRPQEFVMTPNKLPQVKSDLVRVDFQSEQSVTDTLHYLCKGRGTTHYNSHHHYNIGSLGLPVDKRLSLSETLNMKTR